MVPGYHWDSIHQDPEQGKVPGHGQRGRGRFRLDIDAFREKLASLQDAITGIEGELIVARDINSKASDWGSDEMNPGGSIVMEMVARLNLTILNTGGVTTFRRPGTRRSIVDVTLATLTAVCRIRDWRVLDVTYTIQESARPRLSQLGERPRGRTRRDWTKLHSAEHQRLQSADLTLYNSLYYISRSRLSSTEICTSYLGGVMPVCREKPSGTFGGRHTGGLLKLASFARSACWTC